MDKDIRDYLHEINNKISAISGCSEMLLEISLPVEARDKLEKLNKYCVDLVNYIQSKRVLLTK